MKVFVAACLFLNVIASTVYADIIYFKDGMKTICQEKAWEEKDQIKCEYDGWVLTYENKGSMGTNYWLKVRREIDGKAYMCDTSVSKEEQRKAALEICKSLKKG